jgi:hypothetical protein
VALAITALFALSVGLTTARSAPPPNLVCNGTFNNQTYSNVSVPSGSVCHLDSDTVTGNITVSGQIYASSLTVGGTVSSDGGQVVQIDSSTVGGDFSVKNLGNGPANQDSVSIVINTIGGNLIVQHNSSPTGDELVSTNTVHKNEIDASNQISGDLAITAETVAGSMVVFRNSGPGTKEVDGNTISNTLLCLQNQAPFEASDNKATRKIGNC